MVVNPAQIYEQVCQDFKFAQEQNKNKKIILNQVMPSENGFVSKPIRAQTIRDAGEVDGEVIGKVVFYKESDTVEHPVEKLMGQWVAEFNNMLGFIAEQPIRYSELRPMYLHWEVILD